MTGVPPNIVTGVPPNGFENQIAHAVEIVCDERCKAKKSLNLQEKRAAMRNIHRGEAKKVLDRVGYLYVHICSWSRLIKIGYALAADGKRSEGKHTSTFWPGALVWWDKVNLGECTEAEAKVRIQQFESLIRVLLREHLVHKRREVHSLAFSTHEELFFNVGSFSLKIQAIRPYTMILATTGGLFVRHDQEDELYSQD